MVAKTQPLQYEEISRIGIVGELPKPDGIGKIVVATGGTSDIPVAEEAARTAEVFGNEVVRLYDVGVAGLHRLLSHMDEIMSASVIIAIAGMEGALASVIGGLPGYCGAYQRRVRNLFPWIVSIAFHVKFLRQRGFCCQY